MIGTLVFSLVFCLLHYFVQPERGASLGWMSWLSFILENSWVGGYLLYKLSIIRLFAMIWHFRGYFYYKAFLSLSLLFKFLPYFLHLTISSLFLLELKRLCDFLFWLFISDLFEKVFGWAKILSFKIIYFVPVCKLAIDLQNIFD
jgi:hypothetical protein